MGSLVVVAAFAFAGLLQTAVADDSNDKSKQDSDSSLSALIKLADQVAKDDPEADRARPAAEERPARNRKDMPDDKAGEKDRPAAKADRAKPKRAEEDPRPPRRVRDDWPPAAGANRPVADRAGRGDWWGGQLGANPGFGPAGGLIWSPTPYQPLYYGYGLNGYGYGNGFYGYGYNNYLPYYGGYGYSFFPSPVVTTISAPVDVHFNDPAGQLRRSMLEGARRNANNPAGLSPQRR